ncbi:porin [Sphingomonas hankyongi]|uniref:Porin n=1 Tax=Sphingomonas hankyongi TaxID=2908209 RepID=A0ABT0S505_9SPHN|nr:porin [Sphingomonas hankyongi]MCL6730930.1 porin [Sphingomonas hankyongi]
MLSLAHRREAKLLAAVAAAGLLLTPAFAASTSKKRAPAVSVSFDPMTSFTPANADPKLAAALGDRGMSLTDFKFTPAPAKGRPSQVRVAIRARTAPVQTQLASVDSTVAVNALNPTSYNLGVAVGWKRFAISGDVGKVSNPNKAIGDRESAIVGVSYSLNKFTGRVAVGADRPTGNALPALRHGENYSVDVGGSYSLSKRIALTGGVRYNRELDRASALNDERRDSQAVYVGTAFKF